MKSCQLAFKDLLSVPAVGSVQGQVSESSPSNPKKRPVPSSADSPATVARAIQPRPSFIASINGQNDPMMHNIAAERGDEPPKKKRGRPSKADLEQRMAEAEARGQPYPSPKTSAHKAPKAGGIDTSARAQKIATSGAPMAMMVSPTEGFEDSNSATPKKRGRPPKSMTDAKKLELEDTATAAGGIEEDIGSAREVIQETQQPYFTAPEGALATSQEYAAHVEGEGDTHIKEADVHESSGILPAYSGKPEEH